MRPARALRLLPLVALLHGRPAIADAPPSYQLQWGSTGSGNGQFNRPDGLAVDPIGSVYVTDQLNNRIQKFTPTGTYIRQWGTTGSGTGQFSNPIGVATDAGGNVYVVDQFNNRIQKFNGSGAFILQWGTHGTGNGQFDNPMGITIDTGGFVFVTDAVNKRVQKFTNVGGFLAKWGTPGAGNGQFNSPNGIAADPSGNIYVTDLINENVQKFTNAGAYISQWGSMGSGNGQFLGPFDIASDGLGNVYVTDDNNHRVQKFTGAGVYLTQWGSMGAGSGQFNEPRAIALDATGDVYVGDYVNNRIEKFAAPLVGFQINFDTDPFSNPVANGTVVNNTYATLGVTFEKVGPGVGCGSGPNVYANNDRPTGFGTAPNVVSVCPPPVASDFSQNGFGMIHALLAQPASSVGVVVHPDGPGDFAVLNAYDAADNLIGTATSPPGTDVTLTVSAIGIRGARFAGSGTHFCRFDNFYVIYAQHVIDFDHDPMGNPIADGQVVNSAYSAWGVAFDKRGAGPLCTGTDVYANGIQPPGFGTPPNVVSLCPGGTSSDFSEARFGLVHATFDQPYSQVCVDVSVEDPAQYAVLRAYDATDHLIGEATSLPGLTQMLCINAPGIRGVAFAGADTLPATFDDLRLQNVSLVDVPREPPGRTPGELSLSAPFPNPTHGSFSIWLELPAGDPATLAVLDVAGRRMESLDLRGLGPGRHRVVVDAARQFPPGIYLVHLRRGAEVRTTRVILLR